MSVINHSASSLNMNGTMGPMNGTEKTNGIMLRDSVAGVLGSRQLRDPTGVSSSPLQIFVRAKKKINDVYQEIEEYVVESCEFLTGAPHTKEIATDAECEQITAFGSKVAGIKEVLSRDHMKVVFFGRTSNGKSTAINAMLKDKILPAGIGHTTNCFLQVEGDDSPEPFLMTESSTEKQNINGISNLAHALCNHSMGDSSLVRIHWPKDRCQLLRDDVVLVDSPGIDVSECLDEWIDKHCLDADVFVLVANSESTLLMAEKKFFHKVSTKLSKPNIFVLQNRWDVAVAESQPEHLNEAQAQHLKRATDFLVDELKVMDRSQAEQRIFFVSAKEVLNEHMGIKPSVPVKGSMSRYRNWESFERQFEECISKTAVVTKFKQHAQRGINIASNVSSLIGNVQDKAHSERETKIDSSGKLVERLRFTQDEMDSITAQMKEKISYLVEDVERKVAAALNEEIRKLSVLVDEFNEPFHPDLLVMSVYKKTLHTHVESGLGSNLRSRLSSALSLNMQSSQDEMTKRMISLLPTDKRELAVNLLPRREPFEVLYRLNCENLCSDFQEDIEFKFSLGIVSMVQRFLGKASSRLINNKHREPIPRSVSMTPMTPMTPSNEAMPQMTQDDWSLITRVAMASFGSQGTVGVMLGMGFMFKTVGWRLVALTAGVYGALYAYERLTWTTKAKERQFKQQYVEHASRKLRLIVDLTSHNCSHQVQQELSGTFARLCRLVDECTHNMSQELLQLKKEIETLDEMSTKAKKLRNKADYIKNELQNFQQSYLSVD